MKAAAPPAGAFAPALLAWFRQHGRTDLPWQQDPTPYRVWVSEIMLQQTQVATVIRYYPRFVQRFPSVRELAAAPLDAVLHQWSGLGYYARARNLHRAAGIVVTLHAGELPQEFTAISALPGVGRSTAGAILALACGQRQPILDGNVKRVLARWFAVSGYPGETAVARELWRLADAVTPAVEARDFTQAIMDLGATVCTRARPACTHCPVAVPCRARRAGRQAELPAPRPQRQRPNRAVWWLVLRHQDTVLLEQRPAKGIWGGLWGFPEFTGRAALAAHAAVAGTRVAQCRALPRFRHGFTHFDLDIRPLLCELDPAAPAAVEGAGRTWYNPRQPATVGLATPVAALLRALPESGATDAPHRPMRRPRSRSGRPRLRAVSGAARPADLRERLQGRLAAVGGVSNEADQRVSADTDRPAGAQVAGRGNGKIPVRAKATLTGRGVRRSNTRP